MSSVITCPVINLLASVAFAEILKASFGEGFEVITDQDA